MWLPLLKCGLRPPLCRFYVLRRCISLQARSFSIAPARPEEQKRTDPQLPIESAPQSELLKSLQGPDPAMWRKPSSLEGEALFADPVPKILWQDSVSEEKAYWSRKKDQQLKMEQDFVYESMQQYRSMVENAREREKTATLPFARHLVLRWMEPLVEAIKKEQRQARGTFR